jgi:hypothetical protein
MAFSEQTPQPKGRLGFGDVSHAASARSQFNTPNSPKSFSPGDKNFSIPANRSEPVKSTYTGSLFDAP